MIPVYDKANKDRLLGYHPKWSGNDPWRQCMVLPCLSVCSYHHTEAYQALAAVETRRVEFMRYSKIHDDGWRIEIVLITDAPLRDLMLLRDFRLPGESARAAEERRHIQAYL